MPDDTWLLPDLKPNEWTDYILPHEFSDGMINFVTMFCSFKDSLFQNQSTFFFFRFLSDLIFGCLISVHK